MYMFMVDGNQGLHNFSWAQVKLTIVDLTQTISTTFLSRQMIKYVCNTLVWSMVHNLIERRINPLTPRVKPWVNNCGCTFYVCGWTIQMKAVLSYGAVCFLTILQNEIQDLFLSF